jgi:DNA-binding NarL/FixJ family response regulator
MSIESIPDFDCGRTGVVVRLHPAAARSHGTGKGARPARKETETVRVLVVEQQCIVRAGLCALLRTIPGVSVVGEVGTGAEAIERGKTKRPAIVLMGIELPDMSGIEATSVLSREAPAVRVLILSMHAEEEYVRRALGAGAAGYVLKDALKEELELALKAAVRGDKYISSALTRRVVDDYVSRERSRGERLSTRQSEVLRLIGEGRTRREIAERLGVSVKTVESHRAELGRRLGAHDVAALVRAAMRLGLVPPQA